MLSNDDQNCEGTLIAAHVTYEPRMRTSGEERFILISRLLHPLQSFDPNQQQSQMMVLIQDFFNI